MGANQGIRIALLSHHWSALQAISQTRDWAGLAAGGYAYTAADRAFHKACGDSAPQPADLEARKVWCQAELEYLAAVPEVGMYRQSVAQLARRGLHWQGRTLTEEAVIVALGRTPAPAQLSALTDPRIA
jgi:hypothetical protein